MIPPRALLRWLVAALGVTLVATAFRVTEQVMSSMTDHGHDWWRVLVWQLAGWGCWTLAAPVLLARGEAVAEARPWWRGLPAAIAVGALLIVAHILFVSLVVTLVQHFQPVATYSFGEALTRQTARWRWVDLVVVTGLTGLGFGLASYRHGRELELNESRLEAELARAELEALRLQMQPHFLFNTLNSIAALIRRGDRERALGTVVELGELLRETVGRSRQDVVTLGEELAFVERYVELQRTRFADRLEVRATIPEPCRRVPVPTLSLQPLLENAIRHGLAKTSRTLHVEVEAALANGSLRLEVRDDGQGLPRGFNVERDAGVGLGNLRRRLRRMYGAHARLELAPGAAGGTVAGMTIPVDETGPGIPA